MIKRRIFAGVQLRQLRAEKGLQQAQMAALLKISAPYLSQLENDDRPLTPKLIERLARLFPSDLSQIGTDDTDQLALGLREAFADPLFGDLPPPPGTVARLAEQQPDFSRRFVALHAAYRRSAQRLEILDEAISMDSATRSRLPWEEVRDWFHLANNYVDQLDRAAESLGEAIAGSAQSPDLPELQAHLARQHGVTLVADTTGRLRDYDADRRELAIDPAQPIASRRFQAAYHFAALSLGEEIAGIARSATLRSAAARRLLEVGLTNYCAGALLMPYGRFRAEARALRHDVDRLAQAFGTSFEQTCHRLSTLQRDGLQGIPVFFCRVDMAGNITKRHSATRLQFARFGGGCPLWVVHEAAAIPDRVLVQLAETPDGARYVCMAKGLVKPSGRYDRSPRRYAVVLGCETDRAADFVYADGIDLASERAATRIGISCRICPREECDQRAYPPNDRAIRVDLLRRGVVPYDF